MGRIKRRRNPIRTSAKNIGFGYKLSDAEAGKLCKSVGGLPRHGYEKMVETSEGKFWITRTPYHESKRGWTWCAMYVDHPSTRATKSNPGRLRLRDIRNKLTDEEFDVLNEFYVDDKTYASAAEAKQLSSKLMADDASWNKKTKRSNPGYGIPKSVEAAYEDGYTTAKHGHYQPEYYWPTTRDMERGGKLVDAWKKGYRDAERERESNRGHYY